MAAGLIVGIAALFMAPMSLREFCTLINRRDFVLDQLELDSFTEGRGRGSSARLEGRLISTGENYVTDYTSIVGLDTLRELNRERRLAGYRVPVRYLPSQGFWATVDKVNHFRVRTPEDFDDGFPVGLVAANIALAIGSAYLVRRGAGFPRHERRSEAGPSKSR